MTTTDTATEIVAEVAEEVADQATHVAEVSRSLSGQRFGLVFGGFVVGAGLGAAAGYFFAKYRLEEKYIRIADSEIAEMREHYAAKVVALEEKKSLEDIVRERGYVVEDEEQTHPPMAVAPPTSVVEAVTETEERLEEARDIEETPEPEVVNAFQQYGDDVRQAGEWDWHKERKGRSPLRPYVIHIDEREGNDTYDGVTYTYYEEDDVLCNERDEVIGKDERDQLIGEANLNKFGHGSNDPTIVYIRNDRLEMDIEVVRSPNSYAEEVHGFEPEIRHSDRRHGKPKFDDE